MKTETQPAAPAYDEAAYNVLLGEISATGKIGPAAVKAGLSLEQVARRERTDKQFRERLRDARAARRYLIADALTDEALGIVHEDPVNGRKTTVRNINVLTRLAVRENELDPEQKPGGIAINNNNVTSNDPKLIEAARANSERLWALLKGHTNVIDGEVVVDALPAPADDNDEDLI